MLKGIGTKRVRWLPTDFIFNRANSLVRWIDFGSKCITEPFFRMTLEFLRGSNPPAPERLTSIDLFLDAGRAAPMVLPSGVIFHVSRCGSTLLANALKTSEGIVTLSEANPLAPFFRASPFNLAPCLAAISNNARKTFLDALVTLYAHHGATSANARVLIKCHTMEIFGMSLIRQIWPTVPFVILIRDPVEVIVSNLKNPAGWTIERKHSSEFGWSSIETENMSPEEYLARLFGRMCEAASAQIDNNCRVIDYSTLDKQSLLSVASFFGINMGGVRFEEVLQKYAKDPTNTKIFEADAERKQREATPLTRDCVRRWADGAYHHLRALNSTRLGTD